MSLCKIYFIKAHTLTSYFKKLKISIKLIPKLSVSLCKIYFIKAHTLTNYFKKLKISIKLIPKLSVSQVSNNSVIFT